MELAEIGKNILTNCMNVKPGENVLIVTDDEKYAIGQALYQAAKLLKAEAMLMTMTAREVSGQEPPAVVAAAMKAADVVICPIKHLLRIHEPKLRQRKLEQGLLQCRESRRKCLPWVL